MWITEKLAKSGPAAQESGQIGKVTIGGDETAVLTQSENRGMCVAAPGGFVWRPSIGENVLVIKCGEENVVAGAISSEAPEENGEVYIKSKGGAEIRLKNNGDILLGGRVRITGTLELNGVPITPLS